MDFVMVSSIVGVLRNSLDVLFLGGSESLTLAIWGSVLFVMAAGVRALLAPTSRLQLRQGKADLNYIAEHSSLTEGRA